MEPVKILGAPVSVLDMDAAVARISGWIESGDSRYVCVADVHSIMLSRSDDAHALALREADMVTPDGTPLVWFGRMKGRRQLSRVSGPDLMLALASASARTGWKHYLYGGKPEVASNLAAALTKKVPELLVVGTHCPPFRNLTPEEDAAIVAEINAAGPDIVWVGLGCPKQEKWMADHRGLIRGAVLIGVGAAFDFHSGAVARAPLWMRLNGLEWLHRLVNDPRRLWRRYLVLGPTFLVLAAIEVARGWRKSAVQRDI